MNKKRVESYLPFALNALNSPEIAKDGKIPKAFRGQISSFGAAVAMGSFKSAVAFFSVKSDNSESKVDRSKLIEAAWRVLADAGRLNPGSDRELKAGDICSCIIKMDDAEAQKLSEDFIDASVALKLAMNAYTLTEE